MLSTVRTLIVDEIHAVVDDRRGAHLALSIERLAALTRLGQDYGGQAKHPLQRIGLSATQKPIEDVARFLVGTRNISGDLPGTQPDGNRSGSPTDRSEEHTSELQSRLHLVC